MKAVIMAAGKGIRMLPLTKKVPKVLIDIDGKPFLYYLMSNLQKAGFDEFGIIVSYKKEQIQDFVDRYHFNATIINQDKPKGTGHAVLQAKKFTGLEDFVLMAGDHFWSVGDLRRFRELKDSNYITGLEVQDPEKYGVLQTEGIKLVRIVEKPKTPVGNLVNISLYRFTPEIYSALETIELSPRGEYELTDAITTLANEDKFKVFKLNDYFQDLGVLDDIPTVTDFVKGGGW